MQEAGGRMGLSVSEVVLGSEGFVRKDEAFSLAFFYKRGRYIESLCCGRRWLWLISFACWVVYAYSCE